MRIKFSVCLIALGLSTSAADELQSSTVSLIDSQYNSTNYAASNLLDADSSTHWMSSKQVNDINFDMSDSVVSQCIAGFNVTNYGPDSSSLKQFMILTTTDGSLSTDTGTDGWRPMVADANPAGKLDYLSWAQGARLMSVDSQYNNSEWSADNINDGSSKSLWLSTKANNTFEYLFDTDWNGLTGNTIPIDEIQVINYGNDDRSVKEFQIEVTTDGATWSKLEVPGSTAGDSEFIFTRKQNGGTLGTIDSQYNSSSWGAANMQDGDLNTRWLSTKSNNTIEFTFDPNNNGVTGAEGDLDDLFVINEFRIENYGNDDRSIKEFQVAVKTLDNPEWQKINASNTVLGEDFNFILSQNGGVLVEVDSQYNTSSWAATNIHDGDVNSRWLSTKGNNSLAFQFDVDDDGTIGGSNDLFTFDRIYLQNYGNDDRSIKEFQIAVKTMSEPTWQKLRVPGSTIGTEDYNFALAAHGGLLVAIDSQYNTSSWAAKNIHDGDENTRWLTTKGNNTLDFQFDTNNDGTTASPDDLFTLERFQLVNYGNDDRSIKQFHVEVKTTSNTNWVKIPVMGTSAGAANYPFSLAANGASLSSIDTQYNSTSYAAKNLHDGDVNTRWLSSKQANTLAFTFDTNFDAVSGDAINLDTISFVNYGVNDISVQTFEIDIQVSGGNWQAVDAPGGGTVFTATMDSTEQTWSVGSFSNVTAARIRTLTNYGDGSYTGARQLTFSGVSLGPSYTYTAAMHGSGETFQIDVADQPVNVTDVRLRTINNHGDSSYTGVREFRVMGPSTTENFTFVAAMHGNGETFTLDSADVPLDVTDVKLITINNHGDTSYIGAREFRVIGPSIVESKTFTADMHGDPQIFSLTGNNVPINVTAVKLITISNYGDSSYTGIQEFAVVGASVTPSYTFTILKSSNIQNIVLDAEDRVTNIVGVRIHTIQNYGDSSYTGMAEFGLLGTAITPSYIFTAENNTSLQNFAFDPALSGVFRFHSLNNHGNSSYTRASDFQTQTGVCKIAQWRMDEASWSGASGEVVDSTFAGYDGVALGFNVGDNPSTAQASPAVASNPGTCRYGTFDGVDDYILVDNGSDLDDISELTASAWINASSFTQSNGTDSRGIFSQGASGDGGASYSAFFTNSEGAKLVVDIDGSDDRFVSNTTFIADTWYHIAIVFDGKQDASERVKLYVDGVLDGTFSETSSLIPDTTGDFYIGNLFSSLNEKKVFDGFIDEVTIKPSALSQSEISYLMNTTRSCTSGLHHIEIEHDGSGLTCGAETLTIKACANEDCSNLAPNDVVVSLSSSSINSTWSQNPITITAGSSAQVDITNTSAESITLSATPSLSPENPLVCQPSCNLEFFDSGYVVTLDNHTACTTASLTIQAVKVGAPNTICGSAYTGMQSVDFTFNYANPSTGSKLPMLDNSSMAVAGVAQNRTLTFDTNGAATIDFEYEDAGQISIIVSDAGSTGLSESTVTTVVSPAQLLIISPDANSDCIVGDGTCSAFTQAGAPFNLNISAACSNGVVTPNFVMDNIPLSIDTVAPVLGNPVSLGVNSIDFISSDNGVHTEENQTVSEVGVFTVTATPPENDYFGETIAASTSSNIGRFTPAYFELEIISEGIVSSGNPFVYSGQMTTATSSVGKLSYVIVPEFSIIPKALSGVTVANYTGEFLKLQVDDIVRVTPLTDTTQLGVDSINKLGLTATLNTASLTEVDGVLTYQFAVDDHYVYTRNANALIAPFTSDINLDISSVIDSDNIAVLDDATLTLKPYGEEVRFGRWNMENSFGPETSPVGATMIVEHWNGEVFVTNSLDNHTTFDTANDFTIEDISLAPAITSVFDSGLNFFNEGKATIEFASPGEGNLGEVSLSIEVPPWLQYDWENQDNTFDENPSATITFGLYRADDRMLHWRETFN